MMRADGPQLTVANPDVVLNDAAIAAFARLLIALASDDCGEAVSMAASTPQMIDAEAETAIKNHGKTKASTRHRLRAAEEKAQLACGAGNQQQ